MPSPSELARLEDEEHDAIQQEKYEDRDKALAFDSVVARAKRLGFDNVTAALDYVEDVKRGEL